MLKSKIKIKKEKEKKNCGQKIQTQQCPQQEQQSDESTGMGAILQAQNQKSVKFQLNGQ